MHTISDKIWMVEGLEIGLDSMPVKGPSLSEFQRANEDVKACSLPSRDLHWYGPDSCAVYLPYITIACQ